MTDPRTSQGEPRADTDPGQVSTPADGTGRSQPDSGLPPVESSTDTEQPVSWVGPGYQRPSWTPPPAALTLAEANFPAGFDPALPHEWVSTEVGCDDCGTHDAVRCDNDNCPCDGDRVDLVYYDDPRNKPYSGGVI